MENIKVRVLEGIEEKGVAQVEQELLQNHEEAILGEKSPEEFQGVDRISDTVIEQVAKQETEQEEELSEDRVLSYIGKRYNKQINSFDELMAQREESEPMPEDVAAFMKYKKETGRDINDFIKLNKDIDSMNPESLLKEYLTLTQEGLDEEDIDVLMDDYRYDEDVDDESTIRKIKLETKKAIAEAKKFFNVQKEKYRIPIESRENSISEEQKEAYENYKRYIEQSQTIEEENEKKRDWFDQKTNEVFSDDFKGFDFSIDDKKITFSPADKSELKKLQSTPLNFVSKFLDEKGLIKDAVGYHKSLAVAMNPEKFAKFFYEQGKSDAVDGTMRNIKNIQMSERRAPEAMRPTDGIQVKAVNPDSGRNLKIRSIKKM
jgi:hypothetical protein